MNEQHEHAELRFPAALYCVAGIAMFALVYRGELIDFGRALSRRLKTRSVRDMPGAMWRDVNAAIDAANG